MQMSLFDIYNGVLNSIEEKKPELITLLEEHIDFDRLIPCEFTSAFYGRMGRKHIYHLESILRALILQKLLGLTTDVQLIAVLKCSKELREFCGFSKVPDASCLARFKQDYCEFFVKVFERLVDLTEPICREISEKKAGLLPLKEKIRPDDSNQCHNLNKVKFDNFLKPCYKSIITDRSIGCQDIICAFVLTVYKHLKFVF